MKHEDLKALFDFTVAVIIAIFALAASFVAVFNDF